MDKQYSITIDLDKNELNDLLYGEIEMNYQYPTNEDNSIKINVKLKYKEIEDFWGNYSLDNLNKDV
jgi:hypothetical protein